MMRDRGPHALVAVEVGNTTIHVGVFDRDSFHGKPLPRPIRTFAMPSRTPDWKKLHLWAPPTDLPWYVGSVYREGDRRLIDWLQAEFPSSEDQRWVVRRLTYADFPIEMLLEQPEQLGVDRAAAVVAANHLREHDRPAIVIDAGTAITMEGVDAKGRYVGGAILPGITLSARVLENATDLLPYVPWADVQHPPPNALGKSTEQAIRGGLYWGALGAVRQLIERAADELSRNGNGAEPHVLLTGGDGLWLQSPLKGQSVFHRHLVLAGIALTAASLPR